MIETRETAVMTGVVTDSHLPIARMLRAALKNLYDMHEDIMAGRYVPGERFSETCEQARLALANSVGIVEQ